MSLRQGLLHAFVIGFTAAVLHAHRSNYDTVTAKMELAELMSYCSDVELAFDDGKLAVSSVVLGLYSNVLRDALEAHTAAASGSSNSCGDSSSSKALPMPGVSKEEWLQAAPFMYPVVPRPEITEWKQAKLLLKLGAQFDIAVLLEAVDRLLHEHARSITRSKPASGTVKVSGGFGFGDPQPSYGSFNFGPGPSTFATPAANTSLKGDPSDSDVWMWFKLADGARLKTCLPAIASQAVRLDRDGCSSDDNLQGLSLAGTHQLIKALVGK